MYNEEGAADQVIHQTMYVLAAKPTSPFSWQVNNGSTDSTGTIIDNLSTQNS